MLLVVLLLLLVVVVVVVLLLTTTMAFSSIVPCYILDTSNNSWTDRRGYCCWSHPNQQTGWQRMILLLEELLAAAWRQMSARATPRSETRNQQAPAVLMSPASSLPVLLFVSPVLCCSFLLVVLVAAVLSAVSLVIPVMLAVSVSFPAVVVSPAPVLICLPSSGGGGSYY